MRRRQFITLVSGAAVEWPLAARAQQGARMRRIGALILGNADAQSFAAELREGLRKSGYVEGQNVEYTFRSADNNIALLPKLAAELVTLKVDVLVALFTPCVLAAKDATQEIPIVSVSGEPVGMGLVASLARPGGNITGISLIALELHGKCVELLRDALPGISRVAALGNSADPISKQFIAMPSCWSKRSPRSKLYEWRITRIRSSPAVFIGFVQAPDADHAGCQSRTWQWLL